MGLLRRWLMIDQGDGSMHKRMTEGRCPICKSALEFISDDEIKTKFRCNVCRLRINDYKANKKAYDGSV
jgi:DNA-directed RNA polymerase subunit RPC12/RpoP